MAILSEKQVDFLSWNMPFSGIKTYPITFKQEYLKSIENILLYNTRQL